MMKLFALLSVLFFLFKALAAENTGVTEAQLFQEAQSRLDTKCQGETKPESCAADERFVNIYLKKLSGEESDEKKDEAKCEKANDTYNTGYQAFIKDQKVESKENRKDEIAAVKEATEAQKVCSDDIQKIDDEILVENETVQTDLEALERETEGKDTEINKRLQDAINASQAASLEIERVLGTEKLAVENNFETNTRKLVTECQNSVNSALKAARDFMREKRLARNSGALKQRAVNSSLKGDPDQVEAQRIVNESYASCEREQKNIEDARNLQMQTLGEKLAQLQLQESSLKTQINLINTELQKSAPQKQKDIARRLQKGEAKISALTQRRAKKNAECTQELAQLSQQSQELARESRVSRDDNKSMGSVIQQFKTAQDACCKEEDRLRFGKNYKSLCRLSESKIKRGGNRNFH